MVDVWTEIMAKCGLGKVDDFESASGVTCASPNAKLCGVVPKCFPYYDAMLFSAYPIHEPSASKVNRFVASAQVFFHCCVLLYHLNAIVPLDAFSGLASYWIYHSIRIMTIHTVQMC